MSTQEHRLKRNLSLLKWLSIDATFFASAVIIAFELHIVGLSLAQVLLGEAIFAFTILMIDVPTSVFSDLMRRKTALILAEVFFLIGVGSLAFAQNFSWIIVSQIAWGLGYATHSGTDSALLYDTLQSLKNEANYKKIFGRIQSFSLIAIAIGQVLSGFIGAWNLRASVILCLMIPITKLCILLFLEEPPRTAHPHAHAPGTHLLHTIRWFLTQRILVLLVLASATLALGGKVIFHTVNPYWELVNLPIIYWGILMASFNIVGAVIARNAHILQKKIGSGWSFALIVTAEIGGFLLMALLFRSIAAAFFPFFFWGILSFRKIFFSDEINRRTESHRRATTLSIESAGVQLLQVSTLSFLGLYADRAGLPALYLLLAAIIAIIGIASGMGMRKALVSSHAVVS